MKLIIRSFLLILFYVLASTQVWAQGGQPVEYTKTVNPIVLVHGMSAFGDIQGFESWYGIPEDLRSGGAEVYVLQVSAFNSTEVRGEQAARQIENILTVSNAEKVNLIGHSHGGPTSRYVASVYPEYVASVSSVSGVNWGSKVADVVKQAEQGLPSVAPFFVDVVNGFGQFISKISGGDEPQDSLAGLNSLTTEQTLAFNAQYPEGMPTEYCGEGPAVDNGIYYFSWAGAAPFTNSLDILDYPMSLTSLAFEGEANDGLVSACSSHLGKTIRDDFHMNHLDEINQIMGLHSILDTDPITTYRQHANRLKQLGL